MVYVKLVKARLCIYRVFELSWNKVRETRIFSRSGNFVSNIQEYSKFLLKSSEKSGILVEFLAIHCMSVCERIPCWLGY